MELVLQLFSIVVKFHNSANSKSSICTEFKKWQPIPNLRRRILAGGQIHKTFDKEPVIAKFFFHHIYRAHPIWLDGLLRIHLSKFGFA